MRQTWEKIIAGIVARHPKVPLPSLEKEKWKRKIDGRKFRWCKHVISEYHISSIKTLS